MIQEYFAADTTKHVMVVVGDGTYFCSLSISKTDDVSSMTINATDCIW